MIQQRACRDGCTGWLVEGHSGDAGLGAPGLGMAGRPSSHGGHRGGPLPRSRRTRELRVGQRERDELAPQLVVALQLHKLHGLFG